MKVMNCLVSQILEFSCSSLSFMFQYYSNSVWGFYHNDKRNGLK